MNQKILLTRHERAIGDAQKLLPLLERNPHLAARLHGAEVLRQVAEALNEDRTLIAERFLDAQKRRLLLSLSEEEAVNPIIKIFGVMLGQREGRAFNFFKLQLVFVNSFQLVELR